MKKKIFFHAALLFVFVLLQYTIVPVQYNRASPDYILVTVVMAALFFNYRFASVYGLIAGLLCDYCDGLILGLKGALFLICGYLIGVLVQVILSRNLLTAYLVFCSAFIGCQTFYWLAFCLLEHSGSIGRILVNYLVPQFLLTVPFVAVYYWLCSRVLPEKEKDTRRKKRRRLLDQ